MQSYPLADALFKAIGEQLDAGETERHFFSELAEQLWRGNFLMPSAAGPVSQAYASKARLERMLSKVTEIRKRYHLRMFNVNEIQDTDFKRSLTHDETKSLHNFWMNDVGAWMSPDCLQQYNDLMQEADELDKGKGKGKAEKGWVKGKDKGKGKGKGKGKDKGSAAKPAHGPRQQAQQLKKQRFNKVVNDFACKKVFFMSFVRHPSFMPVEGIRDLLQHLTEVMRSPEYHDMLRDSAKKTEEEAQLKRKCHQSRLAVKRGRHDHEHGLNTQLASQYANGQLQQQLLDAERAYGRKKHAGTAALLVPPVSLAVMD